MDDENAPRIKTPMVHTFGDFQASHPRIFVGHDERDAWEATMALWQWEYCHKAYDALVVGLPRSKRVLLSMVTAWLDKNCELTDEEKRHAQG
jgi:hypothetical protein